MTRPRAIVDAHHHVWDPDLNYHPWLRDRPVSGFRYGDYSRIKRRYLVPDYLGDARNWHVAGSVYVEAEWDPADAAGEMDFIAGLRRSSGYPSVAVGQIRLDQPEAAAALEKLASHDFVRSVRQKPRANASASDRAAGGMADRQWRNGFAELRKCGLRFDLQTPWWHLERGGRSCPRFSGRADHHQSRRPAGGSQRRRSFGLACGDGPHRRLSEYRGQDFRHLAPPGWQWTADRNRDVVLTVIDLFGVERCMFGSNFPVDSLCASFDEIYDGFDAITAGFSTDDRRRLFYDNAVRIYAIPRAWLHMQDRKSLAGAE